MWGIRRQVSLLKANGHPDASDYPIGMMFDEARLVVDRQNREMATIGVVIQSATATTGMTAGKEAGNHFKRLIEDLNGD